MRTEGEHRKGTLRQMVLSSNMLELCSFSILSSARS